MASYLHGDLNSAFLRSWVGACILIIIHVFAHITRSTSSYDLWRHRIRICGPDTICLNWDTLSSMVFTARIFASTFMRSLVAAGSFLWRPYRHAMDFFWLCFVIDFLVSFIPYEGILCNVHFYNSLCDAVSLVSWTDASAWSGLAP